MQRSLGNIQGILARAVAAHQAGNIGEAEFLYKLALQADKKQFDALHMLGLIEAQRGNLAAGLERLNDALRIKPKSVEALINLGRMQSELGDNAKSIATYKKAVALDPRSALAHNNLSIVLRRQQRCGDALVHCDAALDIARDYADAWNNRGNALFDLARSSEALESYDRAVKLQPQLAESHLGRGNVLHQLKRFKDALAAYDRALAVKPNHAGCYFGRGNVLHLLKRPEEALAAYDRALAIRPDLAEAWYARGIALNGLGRREDAYAAFAKAFAIKPDQPYAEGERLSAKMYLCAWDDLEAECAHLASAIGQAAPRATPFIMIAASASLTDQMKCAELYVAEAYPASAQPLWRGERYSHERIRVAYISADFRNHAVAHITAGLFEANDRSRFETTAVSIGPSANDEMRARLRLAFDRFLDAGTQTDREIAETLRDLEIDIAVDMAGFTESSRPSIFAQRGVPVQVSYLGYPGTMGASYIDYILADRTVIPAEHAAFYTEKIASLPDTYQANDDKLAIAERTPSRDELHLPSNGFVFCSFNNSYKIRPALFDIWMRLLKQVEGSVLWLGDQNIAASRNLRLEAERRGVASERVVFAPLVPLADHLARQRQADLALDTLPYNGHATTSHALWAGVPVLTCLGSTFAGRVAASLNRAVGLPELVCASLEDYEALALKIATEPAFCASLKDKLARNRVTFPLFDTKRFTRHIETAYTTMWERCQRGEPPQSFAVDPT